MADFSLSYCLITWWWLDMKDQLLANVSNKNIEGDIRSNFFLLNIWSESIVNIILNSRVLAKFLWKYLNKIFWDSW